MSRVRAVRWCFTLNNYTADEVDSLVRNCSDRKVVAYLVYGKEVGEEGTPHLQGYIELSSKREFSTVKKLVGTRAHIEQARGSSQQASDYCKKDGAFKEYGAMMVGAGHRSDLDNIGKRVLAGESLESIADTDTAMYIRYHRGLRELANTLPSPKWRDVKVLVYYGPTGSGKTRAAMALNGGDVFKMNTNTNGTLWFDGYRGESVLLLDDYYGWIKHGELLTLLDGYPYRCQIKGSYTWARWTTVVITSNKPPKAWYAQGLNPALERRLTQVREFEPATSQEIVPYFDHQKSSRFSINGPEVGPGVGGNTRPPPTLIDPRVAMRLLRLLRVDNSYYGQCGVERDGLRQKEVSLLVDDELEVEDDLHISVPDSDASTESACRGASGDGANGDEVQRTSLNVCDSASVSRVKLNSIRKTLADLEGDHTARLSRSIQMHQLVVQDHEPLTVIKVRKSDGASSD